MMTRSSVPPPAGSFQYFSFSNFGDDSFLINADEENDLLMEAPELPPE
jgi:hypothetical protein